MGDNSSTFDTIKGHYTSIWKAEPNIYLWESGPIEKLNFDFRVLEFAPTDDRKMWTYATCCMSTVQDEYPIELHIFSSKKDTSLVELLFTVAYYHKMHAKLNLHHTVNFGRSWQAGSVCCYGLISLPYLDGPDLQTLAIDDKTINFYWLIPITESELKYKKANGIEALEQEFEKKGINYLDQNRGSVVG